MTATLAPGLLIGSAPPANAPPGPQTSGATSKTTSGGAGDQTAPGSFASLLQTATEQGAGTQAGGEPVLPPSGGTPASEGTPTAADLLAQLMALAQGVGAEGEPPDPAIETNTNLLLDRLAEAGGTEDQTGDAAGVVEALMAYLVMGQPTQVEPDAVTAVPGDLTALLQGIEDALSGTSTSTADVDAALIRSATAELASGLNGVTNAATAPATAQAGAQLTVALDAAAGSEVGTDATVDLGTDVAAATAVTGALEDGGTLGAGRRPATPADAAGALPATPQPVTTANAAQAAAPGRAALVVEAASEDARDVDVTPVTSAQANANAAAEAAATMTSQPTQQPSMAPSRIEVVSAAPATAAGLPAEVADIVQTASLNGDSEVRLVLNPPELGHLDIQITRGEHGLRITLEAAQSGARDLIDRSIAGLHQALEARDLRVDRLEVRSTDTGRGSLDTSAGGQQQPGSGFTGSQGDDTPEWSPVAMFERMNEAAQPQQSDTATAAATPSGMAAGSVNVLA
ncbi:MAG: flagellar hook-length control protein FliK [Dehalococcoidia bacterium]